MKTLCRGLLVSLLAIGSASSASAQDQPPQVAPQPAKMPSSLTGKERLGPKWMDEQRLDNCKVPVDKRGARPRSSDCPHIPTG